MGKEEEEPTFEELLELIKQLQGLEKGFRAISINNQTITSDTYMKRLLEDDYVNEQMREVVRRQNEMQLTIIRATLKEIKAKVDEAFIEEIEKYTSKPSSILGAPSSIIEKIKELKIRKIQQEELLPSKKKNEQDLEEEIETLESPTFEKLRGQLTNLSYRIREEAMQKILSFNREDYIDVLLKDAVNFISDKKTFIFGYVILMELVIQGNIQALFVYLESHKDEQVNIEYLDEGYLDSFDYTVRKFTLQKELSDEELEALFELLKSEERFVRFLTIRFLGRIGDRRAIIPIFESAKEILEKRIITYIFWWDDFYRAIRELDAVEEFVYEFIDEPDVIIATSEPEPLYEEIETVLRKALKDKKFRTRAAIILNSFDMQDGFEELIEAVEDENKVVRWKAASLIQNYSPNETVYFQKIKSEETRKDAEKWVKSLDKEKVVEMLIDALNSEEGGNIKYLCNGLISHRMHVELFTQRLLEIVTKENKLLLHNSLKLLKLIENHEPLIYHQIHLEKSDENKKNTRKTLKMLEELGRKSKEDL